MFECISNNEFQIKLQQVFEKTPSECPKEACLPLRLSSNVLKYGRNV